MTANHEMAHQMGYASESECNFIGFLASVKTIIYTSNITVWFAVLFKQLAKPKTRLFLNNY
jgi:hypothetical protein